MQEKKISASVVLKRTSLRQVNLDGECAHENVDPCSHMHLSSQCYSCRDCDAIGICGDRLPKTVKIYSGSYGL